MQFAHTNIKYNVTVIPIKYIENAYRWRSFAYEF